MSTLTPDDGKHKPNTGHHGTGHQTHETPHAHLQDRPGLLDHPNPAEARTRNAHHQAREQTQALAALCQSSDPGIWEDGGTGPNPCPPGTPGNPRHHHKGHGGK